MCGGTCARALDLIRFLSVVARAVHRVRVGGQGDRYVVLKSARAVEGRWKCTNTVSPVCPAGETIIRERSLPNALKTIKPSDDFGGIAGTMHTTTTQRMPPHASCTLPFQCRRRCGMLKLVRGYCDRRREVLCGGHLFQVRHRQQQHLRFLLLLLLLLLLARLLSMRCG